MKSLVESSDNHDLFERVYEELRSLARRRIRQGLGGASLQATALVHEVWLKLSEGDDLARDDTRRYYATAAQAMRWILVDRARRRRAARRAGEAERPIEELEGGERDAALDREILALDGALERLARAHPRKADVVLHRHFAGLSVEETAAALELSTATVKREWRFARAWLQRELSAGAENAPKPDPGSGSRSSPG